MKRLAPARHSEILRQVTSTGVVAVGELASFLGVSRETIRRDLKHLADQNQLDIVHGGASRRQADEPAYELRASENAEGKAVIARLAAGLVNDGMVVLMDSGTTALAVAHALKGKKDLTICTGSLPVAQLMSRIPGTRVHMLGGEVNPQEEATTGVDMLEAISRFRVDVAFIGVGGVSPDGEVTDYTRMGAEQRARMIDVASQSYFLVDRTKFGRLTALRIPRFAEAAGIVADAPPPKGIAEALRERGLPLILP